MPPTEQSLTASADENETDSENTTPSPDCAPLLEEILAVVKERRELDFRGYRRSIIARRVHCRARQCRIQDLGEYLHLLRSDPDEIDRLVEQLTIKVSRFFRNAAVFDLLSAEVLPELARLRSDRALRLWSAGCGYGEEPYSLALLLEEMAGEPGHPDSWICATDVDEEALAQAREGLYPEAALQELPLELIRTYFDVEPRQKEIRYRVREPVRKRVRFTYQDLTACQEPPCGGSFDLICCRNVLIYLERELSKEVQHRLVESLLPGGFLCLGEAEWLYPEIQPLFHVRDRKARLFQRKDGA